AIGTGSRTEVGHIASMLEQEDASKTPLQIRLDKLGKTLGIGAVVICILIFGISLIQGRALADMFLTAVSLAVAAIPEGLAAIVAVVLSLGVTKMARQQAIIKTLPSVETLGSVNIVCSDKTGTLTQNEMAVQKYFTFSNGMQDVAKGMLSEDTRLLTEALVLASDATRSEERRVGKECSTKG